MLQRRCVTVVLFLLFVYVLFICFTVETLICASYGIFVQTWEDNLYHADLA